MKAKPTMAEELAAMQAELSEINKMHMQMSTRINRLSARIIRLKRAETARMRAKKTECDKIPAPGLESPAESK